MNKKNRDDRIDFLINQTNNINNKSLDVILSKSEIDEIMKKYDKLSSFTYIDKNKLKIGSNIRYFNPSNNILSTQCTIIQIQYYDISKTVPKTLVVYSHMANVQWKIICKKYVFFVRISKNKSAKETLSDMLIKEHVDNYIDKIKKTSGDDELLKNIEIYNKSFKKETNNKL